MQPHHDGSPLHVSTQTPALGDTVLVRLRVPSGYGALDAVRVRSNPDHEPAWTEAALLGSSDGWDWWEAPVVVVNPRHGYRWLLVHAPDGGIRGRAEWLNQNGLHSIETLDAEDFALLATPAAPEWLAETVMYQVFPDRFARSAAADDRKTPEWAIPAEWSDAVDPVLPGRSQQFYGGDLDGIVEHIDHVVSLGVTMIYLTPVFPGGSNHRYDAASFELVDPLLGGDQALIRLVEAAHSRGLRVIGDLTSNHSGDRHEWFRAALGNPDAPEGDFYYFTNAEHTEYDGWMGTSTLPKFDWNSQELLLRFIEGDDSVVAKWLKPPFNFDGWRIDVANMTGRRGAEDLNAAVRQTIRRTMVEVNPDTVLLAESTNDAASDLQGDAWHGAMTYPTFTRPLWGWLSEPTGEPWLDYDGSERRDPWFFTQPVGGIPNYSAREFVAMTVQFNAGVPWRIRMGTMNPLDTHDTARFRTNAPAAHVPLALGLSVTLPGVPVVFAGDEFGLTGGDGESSRTPIPWGSEQTDAVAPTLDLYRELLALRGSLPALSTGGLRWVHVGGDAVAFVRETAEASVFVLAARGDIDVVLPPAVLPGAERAELRWGDTAHTLEPTADGVRLAASGPAFAVWSLPGVVAPQR